MDGKFIGERLSTVKHEIAKICEDAGRQANSVRIVAVTKKQTIAAIEAAYQFGQRLFGENYWQEACDKQARLAHLSDLEWHFIGHLQSNKVRAVVGHFTLIHSIDSLHLAEKVNQVAMEKGVRQKILLQINVAGESTKGGFEPRDLVSAQIAQIAGLSAVDLCGIMAFPPPTEDEALGRKYFQQAKECWLQCQQSFKSSLQKAQFNELSMGTSGDFRWAVSEGATLVRLGTTIFGPRS